MRIEITGVLGTGKTTIASLINQNWTIHEDFDTNPFLPFFYQDTAKYAFETEFSFLLQHYHQIKKSSLQNQVCDFALIQDLAYGKMGLDDNRFKIFKRTYQIIIEEINYPNLLIYLKCEPQIILQRIKNRGRQNERNIDVSFIKAIQFYLDKEIKLLNKGKHSKVIEIDTGENDFVHNELLRNDFVHKVNSQIIHF